MINFVAPIPEFSSTKRQKMNHKTLGKSHFLIIAAGVAAIFIGGCHTDENQCNIAKEGENYMLSDSAKTYLNNYTDAHRVIFETLAGDEVAFEVTLKDTIGSYQVEMPCEIDNSQRQAVNGTSQILTISITNNMALPESVFITLVEYPKTSAQEAKEYIVVSLGALFSNSYGSGDELFYYIINGNNPQVNLLDSLIIGGKTFYSVYEMGNSGTTPNLEIKYTMNEGIIYLRDPLTSEEYVYKRKE